MTLISINVGLPREILHVGQAITTGIFKLPAIRSVWLGRLNLEGDGQADLRVHGGADKAVYVYPVEAVVMRFPRLDRLEHAAQRCTELAHLGR